MRNKYIDKKYIESLLRANGIKPPTSDEKIKSVLISAHFNNDEIDTALLVLKENDVDHTTHVDTLHKVFRSNDRLNSSEINELLGITVEIDELQEDEKFRRDSIHVMRMQTMLSLFLALVLAVLLIWVVMYRDKTGVFHPSKSNAINAIGLF